MKIYKSSLCLSLFFIYLLSFGKSKCSSSGCVCVCGVALSSVQLSEWNDIQSESECECTRYSLTYVHSDGIV